ncbi:ABC transporter permease [Candidatus Contubernalis alkaliaceticus]|uniref:ABC transporter permease n=1 Tax=Candidatus Contubernalis alkaliaceticus TaxID=338645 RepID=UPI001F4C39EA|nr:ABC transporter permease [Candidatus Contubernalis alkalaceticus]UNC91602.1 ABC transporter permease [Candidatus Contubernalis alkalaceticus]
MSLFLTKRIMQTIVVLVGVSVLTFFMMNLAPGDPFIMDSEMKMNPEAVARWKEIRQLDRPLHEQYYSWLLNLIKGDFGISLIHNRPVLELITERLPATLLLTVTSLAAALLISIPLGLLSAIKQGSFLDKFISFFTLCGVSIPNFWLGMLLILLFAYQFNWLPAGGLRTVGAEIGFVDSIRHLILPVFVLSTGSAAYYIRYIRAAILEVLGQDYVLTAKAKGLNESTVLFRHIVRNAMIPLVTVVSLSLPHLFTGAMVTEYVFSWPGMGRWIIMATLSRDYPSVLAVNVIVAALVTLCNLGADLLYVFIDPRIKYR